MRIHSETAWEIASQFSYALASSTRDLAALIDHALDDVRAEERERCAGLAEDYPSGAAMRRSTGDKIAVAIRASKGTAND